MLTFRHTITAVIFFALLSFAPSFAQAPGQTRAVALPPIVSPVFGDYKIVCSNFRWDNGRLAQTDLTFDFVVQHADGSPVDFDSSDGAIGLNGWTDSPNGPTSGHPTQPNFDQVSLNWHGRLIGLDPRNKIIHLQFLVRDPSVNGDQSGNVNSDFRLNPVALPQQADTLEPVSQSFTTVWGTVITLTGITYSTKGQYGQIAEQYNFTVDHSKVPDDTVNLQFTNAYDNGVPIENLYQMNQPNNVAGNTVVVDSAPITPGSHASASLEFTTQESSQDKLYSTKWTPITFDVPINSTWPFSSTYTADAQIGTVVNKIQYRLTHIADGPGRDRFLVYTKSTDPSSIFRVTSASWGGEPTPAPQGETPLDIFNNIYFNFDQTLIAPGECGAFIRSRSGPSYYPLLFTVSQFDDAQQPISFSNVPIPIAGQTLVLDQKPDKAVPLTLRLRSITYPQPNQSSPGFRGSQWSNNFMPDILQLTFEYTITDNSTIALSLPPDSANVETQIVAGSSPNAVQSLGTAVVDTDNDTIAMEILLPPTGTKSLNLNLTLSKETPTGEPVNFSISSDDKWSVVPTVPSSASN